MEELKLYVIDNTYIEYLRSDSRLSNVFKNKDDSNFVRKYVGVVLNIGNHKYYVPLSSPKNSDYKNVNGINIIRNDIIPIIRIRCFNRNGHAELKGTLKFSNMIPVPLNAITYYNINLEEDISYKILVTKEYEFIKENQDKIKKHAYVIYNQKTKENILYPDGTRKPRYLEHTVDFKYAEYKADNYRN